MKIMASKIAHHMPHNTFLCINVVSVIKIIYSFRISLLLIFFEESRALNQINRSSAHTYININKKHACKINFRRDRNIQTVHESG